MKNITLSIPDQLLTRARAYAQERGVSLNEMIRTYLKQTVELENESFSENLKEAQSRTKIQTTNWKFDRDEANER